MNLVKLFKEAQKIASTEKMILIFYIIKGIIGLSEPKILLILFSEALYIDSFAILECNIMKVLFFL